MSLNTEQVYTLSDLKKLSFAKKPLAVLGKPIAHSMSPLMHNAALQKMAQKNPEFSQWAYYKFEINAEDLHEALELLYEKNFCGINLTIPHKENAFKCIAQSDEFSKLARAANTLRRTNNGWYGTNTDGFGLEKAIENLSGRNFKDADIVLLGAGGAARAACFHALLAGCKSIKISNRTQAKTLALINDAKAANFEAEELKSLSDISNASIIINASSVGLKADDKPIVDFSNLPKDCIFFDMPYIKGGETSSVIAARRAGLRAESGLPMLAWQGAKALSLWTGCELLIGEFMLDTLIKNNS